MRRHFREDAVMPSSQRVKKITLNGEDITRKCFYFDTDNGVAYCYVMEGGAIQLDEKRRKVHETLNGKIEVELLGDNWQDLMTITTTDPKG